MATLEITAPHELDPLVRAIHAAADRTVRALGDILASEPDSLQVLRLMKFKEIGHHPIDERRLNVIEQVNQTFTYLVTLEAARWLMARHPGLALKINLGTAAGFDLESVAPGDVAAEVFAATRPASNDKLRKDVTRLAEKATQFKHRYVFFSCPGCALGRQTQLESVAGIEVWSLPPDTLLKGAP